MVEPALVDQPQRSLDQRLTRLLFLAVAPSGLHVVHRVTVRSNLQSLQTFIDCKWRTPFRLPGEGSWTRSVMRGTLAA
ncbi:hypothetical protein GCM10010434_061610 [Winogradskya humida]